MLTQTRPTVEDAERVTSKSRNQIGDGISRAVYREPGSYWVYKVCYGDWCSSTNETEYKNYLEYRNTLPAGFALPEMVMLDNGMLAAQYIEGVHQNENCHRSNWTGIAHACEDENSCWLTLIIDNGIYKMIEDMHAYNIILGTDGIFYIIDLGEG